MDSQERIYMFLDSSFATPSLNVYYYLYQHYKVAIMDMEFVTIQNNGHRQSLWKFHGLCFKPESMMAVQTCSFRNLVLTGVASNLKAKYRASSHHNTSDFFSLITCGAVLFFDVPHLFKSFYL